MESKPLEIVGTERGRRKRKAVAAEMVGGASPAGGRKSCREKTRRRKVLFREKEKSFCLVFWRERFWLLAGRMRKIFLREQSRERGGRQCCGERDFEKEKLGQLGLGGRVS